MTNLSITVISRHNDTQHNNTQHNESQQENSWQSDARHNDTQHGDLYATIQTHFYYFVACHYAKCRYDEWRDASATAAPIYCRAKAKAEPSTESLGGLRFRQRRRNA